MLLSIKQIFWKSSIFGKNCEKAFAVEHDCFEGKVGVRRQKSIQPFFIGNEVSNILYPAIFLRKKKQKKKQKKQYLQNNCEK